jgi:hypothetical protein
VRGGCDIFRIYPPRWYSGAMSFFLAMLIKPLVVLCFIPFMALGVFLSRKMKDGKLKRLLLRRIS